jgi:hypothetical protein
VAIQGTQPRVFMAMLEYIYTGRLPAEETVGSNGASGGAEEAAADEPSSLPNINPDTVVELLLAADRFLLDDLKQLCEAALEQSLESSNATWMLELSDRYHFPRTSLSHCHHHHRHRLLLQLFLIFSSWLGVDAQGECAAFEEGHAGVPGGPSVPRSAPACRHARRR